MTAEYYADHYTGESHIVRRPCCPTVNENLKKAGSIIACKFFFIESLTYLIF